MSTAILQTAFLGDLFLSIPLIKHVKKMRSNEPIYLVCRKGLGEPFLKLGLVDEIFEVEKSNKVSYAQAIRELNKKKIQLLICPHQSFRSALMAFQVQADLKIGFHRPWNFFAFHKRVNRPTQLPDALRQLSLLTVLDWPQNHDFVEGVSSGRWDSSNISHTNVDFRVHDFPDWASMSIRKEGGHRDNLICLAPGSVWATKMWTIEGYTEVARQFHNLGFEVKLLGSVSERALCEAIKVQVPAIQNLAGELSLSQSLEVLAKAKVLISNDSGAMHLASSQGTPTVSIFGPTTLDIGYRPWNPKSIVVQKALGCRPCGKHGHKKCPIGTHECMKNVSSEEVLKAANSLL